MSQEIQDLLDELKLTLYFEGQPKPQVQDNWPSVEYNVIVKQDGKDSPVLQIPFGMGVGNFPLKCNDLPPKYVRGSLKTSFTSTEEGLFYTLQKKPDAQFKDEALVAKVRASYSAKIALGEKIVPSLKDVMSCCLRDYDAINYSSFEEWADNFDYDTDSRKAEECYKSSLDTALKLRNNLGEDVISQLQEAYQDY